MASASLTLTSSGIETAKTSCTRTFSLRMRACTTRSSR